MANPIPKSPQVLISEIAIKSQGYGGYFLLLEGSFDMRFWDGRLNEAVIKRIECVGKENLLNTLSLICTEAIAERIFALADRDFDELLNRLHHQKELVYTDKNDLELTLLGCVSSFGEQTFLERIVKESTDSQKLTQFETQYQNSLVNHLRTVATGIGVLRYLNEKLDLRINFDDLAILNANWFNHANLSLDLQQLYAAFMQRLATAQPTSTFTAQDLHNEINTCRAQGWLSGWQLVQGHDFLKLLATALNATSLKSSATSKQTSETSLHRDLSLMIDKVSLQSTSMMASLAKLAPNHSIFK